GLTTWAPATARPGDSGGVTLRLPKVSPVAVTAPCDGQRPVVPVASPPRGFGHGDRSHGRTGSGRLPAVQHEATAEYLATAPRGAGRGRHRRCNFKEPRRNRARLKFPDTEAHHQDYVGDYVVAPPWRSRYAP